MQAAYSIKVAYSNNAGKTVNKTVAVPNASTLDQQAVAFAQSYGTFTVSPVTEAAKVVTTPLTLGA